MAYEHKIPLASLVVVACMVMTSGQSRTAVNRAPQATGARYLHGVWTSDDGLPQNSVISILQTRDGYLWLGTFGGLVRFDGVKFTVFNTGNAPGLKGNRVRWVYEDRAGGLWIVLEYGGLAHYNRGKFYTYTEGDGLPDAWIEHIHEDAQGTLWVSTMRGLFRLSEGRFSPVPLPPGVPSESALYHIEKQGGGLWFRIPSSRSRFPTLLRFHAGALTTYPINAVFIHEAQEGSIWVHDFQRGLDRFKDGAWTNYPINDELPAHKADEVYAFVGRNDSICLLTPNGMARFRDGQIISRHAINSLPDLMSVFEDREGNLWMGGNITGLHRFKEAQITAYSAEEGLADESFVPITGDGQGGLWLGGQKLYHYRAGKFTTQPLRVHDRPWSLYQDPDGGLWAGHGQFSYFKDGRVTHFSLAPLGTYTTALYRDREGSLWVGLSNQYDKNAGGLARFKDGAWTNYRTTEGLVHNEVRLITQDRQGALWIGTTGGMSRFRDGKFTNYTTAQGLSHDYVREIYEDSNGTLWIGTYGGGLNRFRDGRFTPITTNDGLFDNVVSRILEDDRGRLWMSCNRGIHRASRQELNDFADGRIKSITCVSYGVADGMKVSECNGGGQPAGWKAEDGKLWFPTIKGVVVVDPNKVNEQPPPVHIERVLIDQRPMDLWQSVEAPPGKGDLEIHYTGLSLGTPEKVQFKYRLEGYDEDWVRADTRRVVYYTNLPPGSYTFRVIAANNDGVWNEAGAAVRFYLRPHFYQTKLFYAFACVGLVGLAYLVYRRHLAKLRREHALQQAFSEQLIESQESERKRIAAELHDGLGQSLIIIRNRALLSLNAPDNHERAIAQLSEIATATSDAIGEVKEIAYNLRPYQLDRLGLTKALESMIESLSSACPITFKVEIDGLDGLLSKEDEINFYRIVQESVNNIIKHSEATEAIVAVKNDSRSLQIMIQDNGKGFAPADSDGAAGRGFGLIGISERARILGAKHTIRSTPGKGTSVIIKLELREARNGH